MENLYEYILNGLRNSGQLYNPILRGSFEDYLKSLQASVRELRKSYRSSCVVIDYSKPATQAAYLIAYYPHYAQMTIEVLRLLSSEFNFGQEVKACFFCAGPCPKVVGLCQFLEERYPISRTLIANTYDIASETWALTREITLNYIIPQLWQGQTRLHSNTLDLCSTKSFNNIKLVIQSCHLFIFQNCLNEIKNTPIIQNNIIFLLDNAPLGSLVVIADLLYEQNRSIVEEVKRSINERNDFEILQEGTLNFTSSLPIPQIIEENLLTGEDGLIPRSKIRCLFFAIRKGEQISNTYNYIPF